MEVRLTIDQAASIGNFAKSAQRERGAFQILVTPSAHDAVVVAALDTGSYNVETVTITASGGIRGKAE